MNILTEEFKRNCVGKEQSTVEQLLQNLGFSNIRVINFGESVTLEYMQNRANILLDQNGKVGRVFTV